MHFPEAGVGAGDFLYLLDFVAECVALLRDDPTQPLGRTLRCVEGWFLESFSGRGYENAGSQAAKKLPSCLVCGASAAGRRGDRDVHRNDSRAGKGSDQLAEILEQLGPGKSSFGEAHRHPPFMGSVNTYYDVHASWLVPVSNLLRLLRDLRRPFSGSRSTRSAPPGTGARRAASHAAGDRAPGGRRTTRGFP